MGSAQALSQLKKSKMKSKLKGTINEEGEEIKPEVILNFIIYIGWY